MIGLWNLAFKNLIHDRVRLAITLIGITFSVALILIQVGMFFGMTANSSTVIDHTEGDLWIMARNTQNFDMVQPIPETVVTAVRSVSGVDWAENLILTWGFIRLQNGGTEQVEIVGFRPNRAVGSPWNVLQGNINDLYGGDAIFVDKSAFQRLGEMKVGESRELVKKKVRIAGITRGIMSFTTAPYFFTTYDTAHRILPQLSGKTTYVVVKVADGHSMEDVKKELKSHFKNYDIRSKEDWAKRTRDYWTWQTGIGA